MKKTTLALAVAATLALGACGSDGGSEPAKTVTKTAASDSVPADEEVYGDADTEGEDLWAELATYDDAYTLGKAIGSDYWNHEDGGSSLDCTKVNQETSQERDEVEGGVVDVTVIDCERAGTLEQVQIVAAKDADEYATVPVCDPEFEGDTCFTGKGWTIDAENTAMLKEMLEKIDVDHKAWGVGEDLGY